ncbi:hypothetical protein, partial [Alistipes putredinis]|uniref:hypothetical protein n=1 Tax=Alistipes putredinis TaxID=28117 RepID=UPI003A8D3D80
MSEQIRRCVGSIIFVPDRRRFGDLYVRIRTIIRLFLILAQKNPAVFYSGIFFVVCSARALSNGWKSRVSPNSGNYIAKGKGVHREVKSERSWRQTSDL